MARRRRLSDRYRGQVRAESRLRYDPEAETVREAKRDVRAQTQGDIRAARSSARDIRRSARAARPQAAKSFSEALRRVTQGPTPGVGAALGNLGAAAARDSEGARRRLAETQAGLETELTEREQDASAGAASASRAARENQRSEMGKLSTRLQSIARQRGLFAQQRSGELVDEERGRRVTRRGQNLTLKGKRESTAAQNERDAANRKSRETIAAEKLKAAGKDKKKRPRATSDQIITAQSQLDIARRQAKRLKGANRSRGETADLLIRGRSNLKDENGEVVPNTSVQSVKQMWASIALDLEYDGRVSQANRRRLRARGYRLGDFGIKVPNFHVNPGARRPVGPNNKAPF